MRRAIASFVVALLGLIACTPGAETEDRRALRRGGTLRVGLVDWPRYEEANSPGPAFYALDPQAAWYPAAWELFRCCLLRTLVSYEGAPTSEGGSVLRADLARELPEISADGLTWTFRLLEGLRYAPPLEHVEITAPDVIRALERTFTPTPNAAAKAGWFPPSIGHYDFFYLPLIEGALAFAAGEATSISGDRGLSAPDPYTLKVQLVRPTADLGALLALASAAPLPPLPSDPGAELGAATGHDLGYGRYLVASGPYMIEGSPALNPSIPADRQSPVSGWVTGRSLTLVRNPSWQASEDPLRPAYADRIELVFVESQEAAASLVDSGDIDVVLDADPTSEQLARFLAEGSLRDRVYRAFDDTVRFVTLNLATPPFDDVHVRRAVAWALDRAALVELQGREGVSGEVARHVVLDSLENDLLVLYDPFPSQGDHGDLEGAKAEMRRSGYDADGDGRCEHPACDDVLTLAARGGTERERAELIARSLAGLGLSLDLRFAGKHYFDRATPACR